MNPLTGNAVSIWVAELGIWPLVVVIVPNMLFRRYGSGTGAKRMANLMQALAVFAISTVASFVAVREMTDLYFYFAVVIVIVVLVVFRKKVFPYRRTCVECGANQDIESIYFRDGELCKSCRESREGEESAREAAEAGDTEESSDAGEITAEEHVWPGSGAGSDEDDDVS